MAAQWSSVLCACVVLVAAASSRGPIIINKQPPTVLLEQGTVLGAVEHSLHNRAFYSFKGIPYARPPVGSLRFKPPQPVSPGRKVINATSEGPECLQKNYLLPSPPVTGQEDCLYLNVYTPQLGEKSQLPVMVYIYGGGWFTGSGASLFLGPQHLMDEDVLLVTFNYRLGALGFLSTGDEASSGNYAMKDHVAALRWVNKNIEGFGGNPKLVTIFGNSAGGASTHYHMLSPLSKGLFQHAISQSGTVLSPWAWPADALSIARQQGEFVNCTQVSTVELVDCLREVDAHTLVNSGDNFHKWSIDPIVTFSPVIEPEGPDAFLQEHPFKMLRNGNFQKVPWMLGVVAQEGIIRGVPIVSDKDLLNDLNSYWTDLGPFLFELSKSVSSEEVVGLWRNMTSFYFNNTVPVTQDNALGFINMYSDRGFIYGAHKSALYHSAAGHKRIFLYHFNYRTSLPVSYQYAFAPNNPTSYGVSHCDELLYLFNSPAIFQGWPSQPQDLQVVRLMVKLWTNFAKYGNPTPGDSSSSHLTCATTTPECDLSRLNWAPLPAHGSTKTTSRHLYIRNITSICIELSMEDGLFPQRMDFWEKTSLWENFPLDVGQVS